KLRGWLTAGGKILLHQEELSDRTLGVASAYLVYAGLVPDHSQAISIVEQISQRQMGPPGRELVALATELTEPA
ncbi:MAG TPA: hypothetical protein VM942_09985, partial [Acidimicrobiales bacterium]|nr:hypothetical protein [Acidimicrobiales bacterium]